MIGFTALILPASAQPEPLGQIHIGVILPATSNAAELRYSVAQSARQGAVMAQEEFELNASMFEIDFAVITAEADGADVLAAADRLVREEQVFALAGGFGGEEAKLLSAWAAQKGVPFVNLLDSDDQLRNQACAATSFHVAPSAAMYLDALAGWYVRAGFRNWFIVQADTEESASHYERLQRALGERHFGARAVGHAIIDDDAVIPEDVLTQIKNSRADVIVLLVDAEDQLIDLTALETSGIELMVTGYPYAEAQTRDFFARSRQLAPSLGTGMRATVWEPTLDAYGARELNARYMDRWAVPMEGAAWATYQGVKVLFEAAMFSGTTETDPVLSYLRAPNSVFDVWKGIGTSFRSWDHQMRQPLYLTKIDGTASDARLMGQLVGELPAIYMPGTDPVERLDQMGDLESRSQCRF